MFIPARSPVRALRRGRGREGVVVAAEVGGEAQVRQGDAEKPDEEVVLRHVLEDRDRPAPAGLENVLKKKKEKERQCSDFASDFRLGSRLEIHKAVHGGVASASDRTLFFAKNK